MDKPKHGPKFWIGNALMGVALVMMFYLGALWQSLGVWAMGLWMGVAGAGMYFLLDDQGPPSKFPD